MKARGDDLIAPRTAIGFSADGLHMILLTVDGRQERSRGMTEREAAALIRDNGLGLFTTSEVTGIPQLWPVCPWPVWGFQGSIHAPYAPTQ